MAQQNMVRVMLSLSVLNWEWDWRELDAHLPHNAMHGETNSTASEDQSRSNHAYPPAASVGLTCYMMRMIAEPT